MSKKHTKKKAPTRCHGMLATKERQRQNGGIVIESIHEKNEGCILIRRHRAKFESVLDAYLWGGFINTVQHQVGEKFQKEYLRSVHKVKVSDGSGCHGDPEMRAISAINGNEVLRSAFEVLSLQQRELVITVCVKNDRARGTRRIKYFQQALQLLAKEWKMLDG